MKLTRRAASCAVLGVAACVGNSDANEIQLISQIRNVHAFANANDLTGGLTDQDIDGAPGFGLYDRLIASDAILPFAFAHTDASQLSTLTPTSISGRGTSNSAATADPLGYGQGETKGSSNMQIRFSITKPLQYDLDADVSVVGGSSLALAGLELLTETNMQIFQSIQLVPGLHHLSTTGTLQPGSYVLQATALSRAEAHGVLDPISATRASFMFNFTVPEPGAGGLLLISAMSALGRRRARA